MENKISIKERFEYDKKFLADHYIWDTKEDRPHSCLIKDDTTTTVNLGWFEDVGTVYMLTDRGLEQYQRLCANYGRTP